MTGKLKRSFQSRDQEIKKEASLIIKNFKYYFDWYGIASNGDILKVDFPVKRISAPIRCPLSWIRIPLIANLNNDNIFSEEEKKKLKEKVAPWILDEWVVYCLSGRWAIIQDNVFIYPEFYCQINEINLRGETIRPLTFASSFIINEEMNGMFDFFSCGA